MPISNYSQGSSITLERLSSRSNAVSSDSSTKKQKLVFLDQSLKDVMILVNGVQADVEAILLDPERDGIKQITQILSQYPAMRSVHLVAHGSSGRLKLGSTELNLDNINDYAEQLKNWSNKINGASLLIYGCEVAAGETGIDFLERLHYFTQANIAASTAKVGSFEQGGRWQLDYQIGQITDELAFLPFVQENYSGVFANYNEGTSGDISDDPSNPLVLQLGTGVNSLRATSSAGDVEYVTVNVPEGFQLDSLKLASYISTDEIAFAAVQQGTVFTEFGLPSQIDVSKLLGWSHMSSGQVGTNILDNIGRGAGSIGFTGALPSGDYTFWFQQTGEPSTYNVEFNVSPSNNGGSKPVVSLSATPTLLKEAEGTALTLTFSLDKAPPTEGVKVYLDSNTVNALGEFDISTLAFTGGTAPELNQDASGFYFTITAQTATLTLKVLDDGEVEGTENFTYTLQTGEDYTIDPNSNSTTITIQESITPIMTTVSFQTITGTFDSSDNILASNLVRSLEEGASLLTFVFNTEGEIPEGGLVVDVMSDIDLTDYFTGIGRPPFSPGGQILEAIYDPETGEGIGFKFRIDQPNALVSFRLLNDYAATGTVPATFTLESGEGYAVDPEASSSTVTFYDTLANVPTPTVVPEVSFSVSTTDLVESEGTLLTVNFTLSEAPPAEGVLVYVAAPQQFLGDFNIFSGETEGGVFPAPNFRSTGFFFKIYEQEASITIPIFPDGETEGIEAVTISLQAAPGYTIASDSTPITLTLTDTPESEIQVSLSGTPTLLVEANGTVSAHTFTLSAPPPEGGITVSVSAPNIGEFDLAGVVVTGGTISAVRSDGFDLTITEQTAIVDLPVANDGVAEGVETATFTLVEGTGYQISETANSNTFTIADTAEEVPPPTAITEPNDIISLAVETNLSELYPNVSFTSAIDYDNSNRYEVDGGFLYVDASEDVDLYKVELKAGDTIKIDLDSNQFAEGRKVDTSLRVFDASGVQVGFNEDGAAPDELFDAKWSSYLEFTAPADGAYYIGVAIYDNSKYDPLTPASGTGYSEQDLNAYGTGEYTLNIALNDTDAFIAEPTEIPSGTGEGPAISLFTIAGTYGTDFDALGFDIIAPGIAETIPEDAGSALNIVLVADGEIPEGGVVVYINGDNPILDYFGNVDDFGALLSDKPFTRGGQFLDAIYDENGIATGFKFLIEQPFATIVLPPKTQEEAETDGPETYTFSVVESAGYTVSPAGSSTVTFYDTVADIPTATPTPEVSIAISPAELIESEETEFTITLSLSEPPPAGGVQVYVSGNAFDFLNEFTIFEAQFTGGLPASDGAVSGFYFQMFEQTATITLPVFNSVEITEGIEQFNVEVVPGAGYTVNPAMSNALLTIKDTPESQIQVTLSSEPETLIESEGTVANLNFRLSAAPPAEGVTVTVSNPDLMEFDLTTVQIEGAELVGVSDDNTSFTLKITEQNASVKATVYADDEAEASETVTFTVEAGEGYQVDPAGSEGIFTIYDSPETAPTSTEEVNDTIGQAIATGLTATNSTVTFNGEISQYFAEDAEGNELTVDASEDIDFYSFVLEAGQTVKIDVDSIEYQIEGLDVPQRLDSELRLFNAAGEQLAFNFDGYAPDELFAANRDPYLEFTATEAGTYYVGVAQLQNRVYDPLTAEDSSGRTIPSAGRNTGAYEITINLDSDVPPPPTGPIVSFDTITGTFDSGDNILAPELVRSLEEGASLLTFVFNTEGEIPEGGLVVDVMSDIELTDYFTGLGRPPFGVGGRILEGIYDPETGEGIGFKFRIEQPNALVSFRLLNDDAATGTVPATFTIESGEGYAVDTAADSSTVVFYDTLANVPTPTVVPEVNFSVSETNLVESEGTLLTVNFTLTEAPPPEGVLVSIAALQQFLGDFDIFNATVEGGVFPAPNFRSTGFFFKIYEQEASITLPIFSDGDTEGIEAVTLSLQAAPGYTIASDSTPITLTLSDTPESEIQVSLTTTPAILLESEGTASVHTFTLSAPPPEGGITVTVSVPNLKEFDLDAITVVGGLIAAVRENGFDLTVTEQTATVNLPADDDGLFGGLQPITFTLVDGDGYQVSPTANSGSVTIVDDASQIPPPTAITEPNDTIALAVDTKLGDLYPEVSFTSRIDYNNTNRYEVEGGFLYVDASEDVDLYKVELKAGDTIKIDADANQFAEGRKVDTWLRVFDAAGAQLASNDDGAAPDEIFDAEFQSYIEFTAPTDGMYYVGVSLYSNDEYDPNEPASGTGDANPAIPAINEYGPGEYTLNISLNNPDAFIAEPTEIPSGTGEGPAISLFTVAGTYGSDFDNLGFDIIAPGIAETVPEDAGSALNLVLVANGEIPEGGLEVYINSNIAFPDYFGRIGEENYSVAYGGNLNGKPFSRGGEFLTAVYDENGQATGFKFRLEQPFATITFNPINREEAETDGPEDVTFSIVESAGYTVSPVSSSTVTFYDTVADIPTPATTPEVSIAISPTELIESEETEFTITLSLSEPPPPEGVQVYVSGNAQDFLNEFTIFEAQFTGGLPVSDGAVSGFYFQMFEQTATITLPVFNSVEITEGIEQFNVEVVPGAGYTVNPDMGSALLTIKDTPDSQIQVTLTSEPETLIESEGTVATLNFRLSAAPPADGVTVTVSNPDLMEFDLTTAQLEGAELVGVSDDNTSFTLKITEQNASVKATVYADDEAETSETVTFTVEAGEGYQVDPAGSEGIFTIYDSPETAPTSTEEVNDTIGQAIATGLTAANATVTFNGEISQYYVEDDEGNVLAVDASEDIDFYSFTLEAGDTVKLDVDSIAYELEGYPTQRLDSELRLFNAEGVELAANFDGYASDELFVANRDPYLEFTAEAAGTYYVGVAQWQNRVYDPLTGENSSGRVDANAGRNTGAYTLDIDLISSTPPTPVVSLTATPDLITEDAGTPVTFNFTTTGLFPEDGLIIATTALFNPQFDFQNFDFENPDPEKVSGIEYYDYAQTPEGEYIDLWKLTAPDAFIKLVAFDDTVAEEDEVYTLSLLAAEDYSLEDYEINPDAASASVTISDGVPNLDDPIVGISIEPTDLVEGDSLTVTLSIVDGVIPEGGLEVNVSSDIFGSLSEFAIFDAEDNFLPIYSGFAAQPAPNGDANGFIATITENTATITLNVLDDGEIEGPETFTYTLLDGEIYGVDPNASEVTITIDDAPTTGGTFYGTTGDDEFDAGVDGFDGSNNWVFAGAGNDLIDISNGGGNNRVYGQSGNDTLLIGSNDRAFGGSGEDILYFLGGGSTISGGTDSDEFWLATAEYPESANTITDFENGVDILRIGGLGLSFNNLTLTQQSGNTLIASGEQEIAKLLGINSTSLSADNFVFS